MKGVIAFLIFAPLVLMLWILLFYFICALISSVYEGRE